MRLCRVASACAVVAAVRLWIGLLGFCHGGRAGQVISERKPVASGRQEGAICVDIVDFMIAVGLSVLVDTVLGHSYLQVAAPSR